MIPFSSWLCSDSKDSYLTHRHSGGLELGGHSLNKMTLPYSDGYDAWSNGGQWLNVSKRLYASGRPVLEWLGKVKQQIRNLGVLKPHGDQVEG